MRDSPLPKTIAEVAAGFHDESSLGFAIRNFLDEFYAEPLAEQLAEEPRKLTDILQDDGVFDPYLAGISDHPSRTFGFRPPAWVFEPNRVLKNPWYAMKSHGGRMCLLIESPPAFRERDIFISANALSRAKGETVTMVWATCA